MLAEAAAIELKKRTLTNPYNQCPQWLAAAKFGRRRQERERRLIAVIIDRRYNMAANHPIVGDNIPMGKSMGKNEKTGGRVGRIASQGLRAPSTLTNKQIKTLAASTLTQRPDHKKPTPKK